MSPSCWFRNLRVVVLVVITMGGCEAYCTVRLGGSNFES